jgi:hypothetical protein
MTSGEAAGWARDKRRNILEKDWIRINLSDISLFLYPWVERWPIPNSPSDYSSDKHSSVSTKRLYWRLEKEVWKVALEKSQDVPTSTQNLHKTERPDAPTSSFTDTCSRSPPP